MLRRGISLLVVVLVANAAAAGTSKTPTPPSSPATAEVGSQQASDSDRSACTPDVFRLCSEFIPDVDGILACLKLHRPHLSSACRAVIR